jgi:hypothetical protein
VHLRSSNPQKIEDLRAGDCVCQIFEEEEDRLAVAASIILTGLERGEKAVYIEKAHKLEQTLMDLSGKIPDIDMCISTGKLVITSKDRLAGQGDADANEMISLISKETKAALADRIRSAGGAADKGK